MANVIFVTGLSTVLSNLAKRKGQIGVNLERGLKRAGLRLQAESMRVVPVDFGILKASAFTRATGSGFKTVVTVGYTASYAIYVHEAVGMVLKGQPRPPPSGGAYWDPQGRGQAKFLEEPARRLKTTLRNIIMQEGRIKR